MISNYHILIKQACISLSIFAFAACSSNNGATDGPVEEPQPANISGSIGTAAISATDGDVNDINAAYRSNDTAASAQQ